MAGPAALALTGLVPQAPPGPGRGTTSRPSPSAPAARQTTRRSSAAAGRRGADPGRRPTAQLDRASRRRLGPVEPILPRAAAHARAARAARQLRSCRSVWPVRERGGGGGAMGSAARRACGLGDPTGTCGRGRGHPSRGWTRARHTRLRLRRQSWEEGGTAESVSAHLYAGRLRRDAKRRQPRRGPPAKTRTPRPSYGGGGGC